MKDWQTDAIWEAETAAEWERRNAADPEVEKLKAAAAEMGQCALQIEAGLEWLASAAETLNGTPAQAVVNSLVYSIEQANIDILRLIIKYEKGEAE